MDFIDLGTISFEDALDHQGRLVSRIASGDTPEVVLLLEHSHVFTTGRRGLEKNLIARHDLDGNAIDVIRINRGGDVTYHGPGQLVVYPLLDLRKRGRDLNRYLRSLEECVIRTSEDLGIPSFRKEGLTGVWTSEGKLSSIGVGVRQWVTMHGLALNVSTDLSYFELINPCGIPDCPVTSMEELLGNPVSMTQVKDVMKTKIAEILSPPMAES